MRQAWGRWLVSVEAPSAGLRNVPPRVQPNPIRRPRRRTRACPTAPNFVSWEQPLKFSKTYYVDNNSAKADDNGPGTSERPFRTINKAAQVLQPGERVVIASGTYRECVRPARGGTGPAQMISYEAAPGATVFVKGSEILKDGWQQESIPMGRGRGRKRPGSGPDTHVATRTHRHDVSRCLQPLRPGQRAGRLVLAGHQNGRHGPVFPPARIGLCGRQTAGADGAASRTGKRRALQPAPPPHQSTRRLAPACPRARAADRSCRKSAARRMPGSGWKTRETPFTSACPPALPPSHLIEITTREQAFVPLQKGLAYIRVKGITFQHAGNGYPLPQRGLVSTAGGNHWIIEGNTIEWANGVGLDIGNGDWNGGSHAAGRGCLRSSAATRFATAASKASPAWEPRTPSSRTISSSGAAGPTPNAPGKPPGPSSTAPTTCSSAATSSAISATPTRVWLDSGNANCRITGNVFADVLTVSAAVHMEMNRNTNQIDNNVIWNVRNAEPGTPGQRGCAGSGIFINATDRLIIAQNLIGRCDNSGVFAIMRPDRAGSGTAQENNIYNNIFASCGKSAIVFLNQNNEADGNLYVSMPSGFCGFSPPTRSSGSTCRRGARPTAGTRTEPWLTCRSTSILTAWS